MGSMNDAKVIRQQYANADGLNIRMALHAKYSVNKEPYIDWIAGHYRIQPGMRVLELGCGTANTWIQPERWLPDAAELVLTDLSEGMLETARKNVPNKTNISFSKTDIQQIPYEKSSFDLVIANAMLYHVPDLDRALREVARVLKPDGRFLCATTGENGTHAWFQRVLGVGESPAMPFSMQNGREKLKPYFGRIELDVRQDALDVTDADDLAAYILSTMSFSYVKAWPIEELRVLLMHEAKDGVIHIPKENGMFQCYEPNVTKIFD